MIKIEIAFQNMPLSYGSKKRMSPPLWYQVCNQFNKYLSNFASLQQLFKFLLLFTAEILASGERKITLLFGVTRIRDVRDISVSCAFLKTPLAEVPSGTTKKFNMTFKFHPFFALLSRTTKYGLKGMLKPFFSFS